MLASATTVQLIAYRFESHRAQAVGLAVMIGGELRGRQCSDGSANATSHPRA
jgi:hypothetical protein